MNKSTVNSVENMCRTCMTEFPKTKRKIDNKKQSIHEVPTGSKNKTSIMELLQLVQPQIRIEIEDHLPTLMCSDCVRKLLISHEFIEMYRNVDEKFRKMLEEINIDCKYEFNDLEEPLKIVDENDLTVEMVEKDEIHEIAKFELEIEQVNLEDLEKEEENENDWPKFEDELLQEMSEQENDKEPVFVNPYSDASDNEWTPPRNRKKDSPKKTVTRKQKSGKINDRTTNSNSAKKTKRKYVKERKQNTEDLPLPVENEDGRVQCQQCDSVLDNKKLWHEHVLQHQPKERPKRKYVKKSDQIKNGQSNQKEYECEHCGKGFASYTYFKVHKRIHSVEQPFLCTECGKGFKVNSSLYTHMLRHKGVKKYQCSHCPKKFVCSSGLYGHMLVHTNKKSFVCDTCGSAFRMGYELKKHERCHNGIKNFPCEYCDKKFITREKQLRHIRTHTGEKPYRCKYCGRAFAQSNDCVKHLRQHLGDNVYQCEMCPLRFPLARELRAHFATHRNDDEETRASNLKARTEDERNLQIKFGLKNSSNLINSK